MLSVVSSLLASLSLALKQPLAGYCDVETTHGDALVTKQGDYCTFVRIGGMKRMATRDDITRLANGAASRSVGRARGEGPRDRRLVSLGPRRGRARDRADQYGVLPPCGARSRPRPHRHSRRAPTPLESDDALGDVVLRPVDAPRGADQGRSEADEGGEVGGGESGSEDRRRAALLSPLGAHGRPPCRLRQPGDGGAARRRSGRNRACRQ